MSAYPALILLLLSLVQPRIPAASYEGTVQALKAHPPAVDVVTGVGFALRLIHVSTVPATVVDSAGTTIPMAHIQRGDYVRVDCSASTTGLVADHIAKLEPRGSKAAP